MKHPILLLVAIPVCFAAYGVYQLILGAAMVWHWLKSKVTV